MEDDDFTRTTCLSSDPHEPRDYILHYMGCIEISERAKFFDPSKNKLWEKLEKKAERIKGHPALEVKVKHLSRQELQKACESEVRRARHLRNFLAKDADEKHLVDNIKQSGDRWRSSELYQVGIEEIRKWQPNRPGRDAASNGNTSPTIDPNAATINEGQAKSVTSENAEPEGYNPERDINVHVVKYHPENGSKNLCMTADDKMKVRDVLDNKESGPLRRDSDPMKTIKYVHLPANNMEVRT